MFIDSHSHLNFKKFQNDYKTAINVAVKNSVGKIIVVGSNFETSEKALDLAYEFPKIIFAAIGLHPIHALDEKFDDKLIKLAKNKKVIAIGETGLDYFHLRKSKEMNKQKVELQAKSRTELCSGAREKQKTLFIKHLQLAQQLEKPVILHCRDAFRDLLPILKAFPKSQKLKKVLHCYDGNLKYLQDFLDLGCLISFTGNITYGSERDEAIRRIPVEKIMIETDAPYLAPVPYKSTKNQPSYVVEVAKYIAKIKNIELEKLEKILENTTKQFFNI